MRVFKWYKERGFSYPELLVVIVIIAVVFYITVPLYKRYTALVELQNTAQKMRDQLRTAQNKAVNGVVPSNGMISHWILHLHRNSAEYEYESGACPIIEDSSASGYSNRYNFNSCQDRSDYVLYAFPQRFSIIHQYAGESETNLFFYRVSGTLGVYSGSGAYLGDTIDIRIESDDYPDMYVIFHVNSQGNISEEKF